MEALQEGYQVARKKIYTLPIEGNSLDAHNQSSIDKYGKPGYISATEVAAQVERFRLLMREKDGEILKLKHETSILKQIERRQQKDIDNYEMQTDEAPVIIKSLQDEISRLKFQIKKYYNQIAEDSKQIRSIDEERRRLLDQNRKLEQLNQEKKLLERVVLIRKLSDMTTKLEQLEETVKKYELSDRNISSDNRQLRGKIHSMEKEILILRDRTVTLDSILKEKEKNIASLSIYRYNAIHRKIESICKTCMKRDKLESEMKRKSEIIEKLPKLESPTMSLLSSTSAMVSVIIPDTVSQNGEPLIYSRLTLIYSNDPNLQENTHKILIDLEEAGVLKKPNPPTALNETHQETDQIIKEDHVKKQKILRKLKVTNLDSGKHYYFQLVAGYHDVDGIPTIPESIFVDGLPNPPPKPVITVNAIQPQISVIFESGLSAGSVITSYRIYHSLTQDMKESFLIAELQKFDQESPNEKNIFIMDSPELRVSHYFRISSVNAMGEGPLSEISEKATIDYLPNKPSTPCLRKLCSSSVKLSSAVESNGGSDIETFKIEIWKFTETPESEIIKTELIINATSKNQLEHEIKNLEPGMIYQFRATARNIVGDSVASEWSDHVNLDALVPLADPPIVKVLSPTSVELFLPNVSKNSKPTINGFRIVWSETLDIFGPGVSTVEIAVQKSTIIEHLKEAETYYFAISLISGHEEGLYSSLVYAPLSSALKLPDSPILTHAQSDIQMIENSIYESGSPRSSQLSLDQKLQNMHDGIPAFFDPETKKLSLENMTSIGISRNNSKGSFLGEGARGSNRNLIGKDANTSAKKLQKSNSSKALKPQRLTELISGNDITRRKSQSKLRGETPENKTKRASMSVAKRESIQLKSENSGSSKILNQEFASTPTKGSGEIVKMGSGGTKRGSMLSVSTSKGSVASSHRGSIIKNSSETPGNRQRLSPQSTSQIENKLQEE